MLISRNEIEHMSHLYRVAFINSLSGFKSANLVGTVDQDEQTNLSIVSSVVHIGAHPPLIAMIIRPNSVDRHTLENLMQVGYYTLNHTNKTIFKQAHQTSARYPKEISEFAATGLTEDWREDFPAPYVKESRLSLGMQYRELIPLAINGTELIIGEIQQVWLPEEAIQKDGLVDIESLDSVAVSGLDSYHATSRLARLSYAKPDKDIEEI